MKRIALVSLAGFLALAACSSGGNSSAPSTAHANAASGITMAPYQMPLASGAMANIAAANQVRHTTDYGGIPCIIADILLIDAPALSPGAQVNLAIVGVEGLSGGNVYPIVSYSSPVIVNALNLQASALNLGSNPIPALKYDGLRFIIDPTQSSVVNNGTTYSSAFGVFDSSFAFTPFASGLANVDFMQPFDATAGPVTILVDFNVAESVKLTQGGVAEIGPRLTGTSWSTAAVISGQVVNASGSPVAGATVVALGADGNVVTSSLTGGSGNFQLHAIPGATYSLVVYNSFIANSGVTFTASGADSSAPVNGPTFTVPPGYQANVGTIKD